MDQETKRAEEKVLDRRSALKAMFGLAAVAVGAATLMVPGAAEAATIAPGVTPTAPKEPDAARDEDLPDSEPTQYYYRRRVYRRRHYRPAYRRRYYHRPRRVYRRRYIRRIYY